MTTNEPLSIQTVPISQLTPDPENVRTHDQKNLDAIKASLSNFGQRKPIVVATANDGRLVVIAGNGTLEAAKSLGWKQITVARVPDDWDADKARAFAIADNRTAELADWNEVGLASALLDLEAVGWEPAVLGFSTETPDFTPDEEEDVRLDRKSVTTCPACGCTFVPVTRTMTEEDNIV